MDEDILSGITPVDASVVRFAAALYNARERFTVRSDSYTVESVFAKRPKAVHREIILLDYTKINRHGKIFDVNKGETYPVGKPDGLTDHTILYPTEADFLIKRELAARV